MMQPGCGDATATVANGNHVKGMSETALQHVPEIHAGGLPPSVRLGAKEAAERLGLNRSTVWRQAKSWGLLGDDKRIDLSAYMARRRDVNPAMIRQAQVVETVADIEPAAQARPASAVTRLANPVMGGMAEKVSLQAEELRLRLAERRRELVPIVEVRAELAEAARIAKAQLLSLPGRVAGELARESDPDRIEKVLQARVTDVLTALEAAFRRASADVEAEASAA